MNKTSSFSTIFIVKKDMTQSEPFLWVMSLSIIGTMFSFVEMNEALRFVILLGTSLGVLVKTWEQVRKSDKFQQDIVSIWTKIKQKINKILGK